MNERNRTGRARSILKWTGYVLVSVSLVGLLAFWLFPNEVEEATGRIVEEARQVRYAVAVEDPEVRLGGEAQGLRDIDVAPHGVWLEMASYRVDESIQPTFAQHNTYGGDIVLRWEIGQEVTVIHPNGREEQMRVTDTRVIQQHTSTTQDLRGMSGSILLQSCFYDFATMRVVALTPVGEDPVVLDDDGTPAEDIVSPDGN